MRFRVTLYSLLICASLHAFEIAPGEKIYSDSCAKCHDAARPGSRVPSRQVLQQMSADSIFQALESGVMSIQGKAIGADNRRVVADYLGTHTTGGNFSTSTGLCPATATAWTLDPKAPAWNGWSPRSTNTRFADARTALLDATSVPRLKLKWAFSLGDTKIARAQPVLVSGRVFTSSQTGDVFSLDAQSGCTYWKQHFPGPVRGGIVVASVNGRALAIVGDTLGLLHALDAATGQPIWIHRVDDHPAKLITATPQFHDGIIYVSVSSYEEVLAVNPKYACCSFRGSVSAIDAATGNVIWKTYTIPDPPKPQKPNSAGTTLMGPSGAAVWSTPTIDPEKNILYISTGDNYSLPTTDASDAIVAIDRANGKILWSRQLTANDSYNVSCDTGKENCPESHGGDFDFGSSPALVDLPNGHRALVAGQKSGMLHALDPDQQGKVLWSARLGHGGALGGTQWGSAVAGDIVFTPLSDIAFDGGSGQTALQPSPTRGGGLFAYRISNGERLWQTPAPPCGDRRPCSPAQSAAATAIPGVVFSGSLDGHLRAYSAADGKIIWDFDTAQPFTAVNGQPAHGGSLDAGGPAVANGLVLVNSGYSQYGGLAGNVLLCFSVDGK